MRARAIPLVIVGALAAGWDQPPAFGADPDNEVLAKVGGAELRASEVRQLVRNLDPATRAGLIENPAQLSRLVRAEATRRVVLADAKAKRWDEQPSVLARIERAKADVVVASYLDSVSAPPAGFPSEREIEAAYDANRSGFVAPRAFQVAQIFVALEPDADRAAQDKARKKVDDLVKKARQSGAGFAELARLNSEHAPSARGGGDLGWLTEDQIVPEIRGVVIGLAKGEISEPIRTPAGWHIVKLVDTKAATIRPLAEVRDTVVAALRQRKTAEAREAFVARLLEKHPLAVNEIAVSKLLDAIKQAP